MSSVIIWKLRHKLFKGSVSKDFRPPFFHDSNPSRPMISIRIRFWFVRKILTWRCDAHCRDWLSGVMHTAEIDSTVRCTPRSFLKIRISWGNKKECKKLQPVFQGPRRIWIIKNGGKKAHDTLPLRDLYSVMPSILRKTTLNTVYTVCYHGVARGKKPPVLHGVSKFCHHPFSTGYYLLIIMLNLKKRKYTFCWQNSESLTFKKSRVFNFTRLSL